MHKEDTGKGVWVVYVCKVTAHLHTELTRLLIEIIEILASLWDLLSVSTVLSKSQVYVTKYSTDRTQFLGGFLANPATQYSAFQNVAFFHSYPYALPGFVSGAFCLSASIVGIMSLKEVSFFLQHVFITCNLMIITRHSRVNWTPTASPNRILKCQPGNS